MTVTAPQGFQACGLDAGVAAGDAPDLALVVNRGPKRAAAGLFTANRVQAAPVLWSRQVLAAGALRAVVLNSGGANSCTGPLGFQDAHRTAEHAASLLDCDAAQVAVCSTGPIGARLPVDNLLAGLNRALTLLSDDGGDAAALAIRDADAEAKMAVSQGAGFTVGGMAAGMGGHQAGLATLLVVLTTDADLDAAALDAALRQVVPQTFDRIDTAGATSTNDTVLLLASGASGHTPTAAEFQAALEDVCAELARRLVADADGLGKDVVIMVEHAANEADAREVGRALARSDLLGGAILAERPNWARVLSAVGATSASFEPERVSIAVNGVWVCRDGSVAPPGDPVDTSAREVRIAVDLGAGAASLTAWTNDQVSAYVARALVSQA